MSVSVHFSTGQDEWPTPRWLFDMLDSEFGFDLDVCASADNALCERYYTKEDDALTKDWWRDGNAAFCNAPYSRAAGGIGAFLAKGRDAANHLTTAVFLVPARPDTEWWARYVMQADEVRLLQGRLKFGDGTGNAPFPSAVVIFRPQAFWHAHGNIYILTPAVKPSFSYLRRERIR